MEKTLIIFTNEDKLKEVLGANKSLRIGYDNTLDDIHIELINDSLDEARLVNNEKPIEPKGNNEHIYFVLHTNAQQNYKNKFEEMYPGAKIELQSHVEGEFYYTCLPKIEDGSFNQNNLENFFQTKLSKALNELWNIWNAIDFADKEAVDKLEAERLEKLRLHL